MENKEQTGMSLEECKDAVAKKYGHANWSAVKNKFRNDTLHVGELIAFCDEANMLFYASQPVNSGWVKIDSTIPNQIPNEDVFTYWFNNNKVVFVPKGEYVPLGVISHYMLLVKPSPPKQ